MQDKDEIEMQRAINAQDFLAQTVLQPTTIAETGESDLDDKNMDLWLTQLARIDSAKFKMVALSERCVAYKHVSEARALVSNFKKRPISKSSEDDYTKKTDHMLEALSEVIEIYNIDFWKRALGAHVNNSSTFRGNRSAVRWKLRECIAVLLAEQDMHQRVHGTTSEWQFLCEQLQRCVNAHQVIGQWSQEDFCAVRGAQRKPKKSKKEDLIKITKVYVDWQARMRQELLGTKFNDALLVMERIGCRPSELVGGVEISLSQPGWFSLKVRRGSKVTKDAGQKWRVIHLPIALMPECWRAATANHGTYLVQIENVDQLRNKMQDASKKALPGVPYVTANVYRHALPTLLRVSGFEPADIAAAMGHSVAHTQAGYGIRGGGKRKPKVDLTTIARFEVPRKVKPRDRSGLEFVLAKKKASKKFKAP